MTTPAYQAHRPTPIEIQSSLDQSPQPCIAWKALGHLPRPLLIALHTWGGGYDQNLYTFSEQAMGHNWHCMSPHFRGPNIGPDACGSPKAIADIHDAVRWAVQHFNVDEDRIYLAGGSGGAHMAMQVAAHLPATFAAVSAWCGISDLAAWHAEHTKDGAEDHYAKNIVACTGGQPGSSRQVDEQYTLRSPIHHLHQATNVAFDLVHGVHDGRTGSVPCWHTIRAFNVIAKTLGLAQVTEDEISQLWNQQKLEQPTPGDLVSDPAYQGRQIHLRRHAGPSRVTIFEGSHEALPFAACQWLATHSRKGDVAPEPYVNIAQDTSQGSEIAG